MSLLYPLYLLGTLAVALPLYLHLKRKPPTKAEPVGSLMFWRPADISSSKRTAKLEDLLLLLLRCLAVLLLALMFTRPFLKNEAALGLGIGNGERYVILLDTSASMQRDGAWKIAQNLALKQINRFSPNDSVSLVFYDRTITEALTFQQWEELDRNQRIPVLKQLVKEVSPGWASSQLDVAMLQAVDSIREAEAASDEPNSSASVIVVTDLQSGSSIERLASKTWPEDISITFERIEADYATNSFVNVVATSDPSQPKVRITNGTGNDGGSFKLVWTEGEVYETHYVAPGSSVVVTAPPGGDGNSPLQLVGDNIGFDNTVYFPPAEPAKPLISVWSDSLLENEGSLSYYLEQAMISTSRMQPRLELNKGNPGDFYIVDGSISDQQATELTQQVEAGKSCLFVVDRQEASRSLGLLLGIESPIITTREFKTDYAMFQSVDFKHPVMVPFAAPSTRDFSKVRIWKYREIEAPKSRTIISFEDGAPALFEYPVGRGRVFALTTSWDKADSQLARSTKFVPLLYSLFRESGLRPGASDTFMVGDTLPLDRDFGEGEIFLNDTEQTLDRDVGFVAGQPGHYQFHQGDRRKVYAVNLDPKESQLEPMSLQTLARFGLQGTKDSSTVASASDSNSTNRNMGSTDLEQKQKWFRWLSILIFILILFETVIAGRKRSASTNREPVAVT